jgi:magnesium transporter
VVAKILWNSLETFNDPAQRLGEQIDFYEHNLLLRNSNNTDIQALYNIKQRAAVCNKVLLLMYEPINHLQTQRKDDPVIQDIRDQHLKMQTLFSQVLEDVNNLMNLYISYSAQRTSDVMKVLTMFSAFFLPLTFLVGIYGMNFRFMPELSSKWGYPVVILVMIIITMVIYFWFKKKKWL